MSGTYEAGVGSNEIALSRWNGTFTITIRWTWDGVASWPNGDGNVESVTVTNNTGRDVTVNLLTTSGTRQRVVPSGEASWTGARIRTQLDLEKIQRLKDLTVT